MTVEDVRRCVSCGKVIFIDSPYCSVGCWIDINDPADTDPDDTDVQA